mmetsp:Transcript_11221/g.33131  ORF Transcript_11221/g.33131 Transcript_11221/m.33131 type:complete len:289 (+) Transcript_11221:1591-2457(+)
MASQPRSITSRRTLRNGLPSSAILCSFGKVPREQGNSARSLFDASRALRLIHRPRLSGSFCRLLEETSIVAINGDGFKSKCCSWLCPMNNSASAGKDGSCKEPCNSFWRRSKYFSFCRPPTSTPFSLFLAAASVSRNWVGWRCCKLQFSTSKARNGFGSDGRTLISSLSDSDRVSSVKHSQIFHLSSFSSAFLGANNVLSAQPAAGTGGKLRSRLSPASSNSKAGRSDSRASGSILKEFLATRNCRSVEIARQSEGSSSNLLWEQSKDFNSTISQNFSPSSKSSGVGA